MNRIREFRQLRGWSMQQLADAASTSKGQIDKLEKGDRRLTVDWMVRLSKPLQCDPRALMATDDLPPTMPLQTKTARPQHDDMIPVRSFARGGKQQTMFLADGPVDYVPRPYYLGHARDAYAIVVTGSSMVPMYRPGQLLFVNPHKLPAQSQGVIITHQNNAVQIKEFIREKAANFIVREYHPEQRDLTIAKNSVVDLHCVVGLSES